jgi:hypothetical protein
MLQMMTTKRIGRRQFHFTTQGVDLHAAVAEKDRLSFQDVNVCGCCGSDNLDLVSRVAQDKFKYTSVKCLDCRADLTFGKTQKDEHTYFLRRNDQGQLDWKPYSKEEQE